MKHVGLSVSELASRAGISAHTVRYYGRLGLLPETGRTAAGHRFYDDAALERLRFIKGAQWFELRLEEIRELLEAVDGDLCPCGHSREVVLRRIAAIDEQQGRLSDIRAALCRLLSDDPIVISEPDVPTPTPCGCCTPSPPLSADEELRELRARQEAVERRLAGLRQAER